MARLEARVFGFVIAVLVLVLAVALLGWSNHRQTATQRRLRGQANANSARVGQLEGQLRDHGIEPVPATTTTTVAAVRRRTTTTRRAAPATVPPTTTTTARPSPTTTTTTTEPPPSTTTSTQCVIRLGKCVL